MKKGFATVYIVIMLSSMVFLVLVLVEVSSGHAAGSIAENVCSIAGESLLSEYQSELCERYGVLALTSDEERLAEMAKYYIEYGIEGEGDLVALCLDDCRISCDAHPALDVDGLSSQLVELGAMIAAKELITETDILKALAAGKDAAADTEDSSSAADALHSLQEKPDLEEGEEEPDESKRTRAQARELRRSYMEALKEDDAATSSDRAITDQSVLKSLPSHALGVPGDSTLLLSGGIASAASADAADAILENEYIVNMCGNAVRILDNSVLGLEAEYILFGQPSDKENERITRRSLFLLRSSLNLAFILSDESMLSQVTALAESAFALLPLPLSVFIISSVWAAIEAKSDVSLLYDGKTVPFVKGKDDWRTSLLGAMGGSVGEAVTETVGGEGHKQKGLGAYEDYIRVLLLARCRDVKLVRLMDIMELNIGHLGGKAFRFQNYAYGFVLTAHFSKAMHIPGGAFTEKRYGEVTEEHVYR